MLVTGSHLETPPTAGRTSGAWEGGVSILTAVNLNVHSTLAQLEGDSEVEQGKTKTKAKTSQGWEEPFARGVSHRSRASRVQNSKIPTLGKHTAQLLNGQKTQQVPHRQVQRCQTPRVLR